MISKEYKCDICNKLYATYKSLWDHNKKFHKSQLITDKDEKKIIKCDNCNKIFSSRQAKYLHNKKTCKINPNNIELEDVKKSLNELKELFIKNCKIHPKTLQKINKDLINNNITFNTITNNTINNTNSTINNTTINKTFVNFHNPIDYKILSKKEIINIISKPWKSLEESIKTIHFNKKLPEYNNIFITNLKDNNAYIFNGTKFCSIAKNEAINDLITSHLDEIESSATDYSNNISENKLKHLHSFIETIGDNDKKFVHESLKKTYTNYRIYKSEIIKHLIYNNSNSKLLEKLKNIDLENKISVK